LCQFNNLQRFIILNSMDTNKLKVYAPTARREFIQAVTERAHIYGISENGIDPCEVKGDFAIINGRAFPKQVDDQRNMLEEQVKRNGFVQVMEAVAYTWFNRFAAIRYMELHGFLSHGYRVLSHPAGNNTPEILEKAQHVELTGLDKEEVINLKMDGTKDEELYSKLLIAECNELSKAMPFLFEYVQDYTELLLPDNLLNTDSVIRQMVDAIPEEDWTQIEIIGWLYQFYISEKKDDVIGKVVKSEDIPAATQLFTPNWIVKYMVQNSLGAQWLVTYPQSPLKGLMEYYIEPVEQTDEVKAQLVAITPGALNPEELTLIDPASGSGHILVEAYDLFKAIYLERGYRQRDVAQLILEKNLYGLDIDERAAQLTGFALMMKGRADDRRLFERGLKLNVMVLQDSTGFDAEGLIQGVKLAEYGLQPGDLTELKRLFEHATTFGSLIQVPDGLTKKLLALKQLSEAISQNLFVSDALKRLGPLVRQAELLATQYDAVVVNPPYMGRKYQLPLLKGYLRDQYRGSESDSFSAFIDCAMVLSKQSGRIAIVAPYVWMFLSSYGEFREKVISRTTIASLIQLEYNAFEPAMIPVATFTLVNCPVAAFRGSFIRLSEFKGHQNQAPKTLEAIRDPDCGWLYRAKLEDFAKLPQSPVAYWVTDRLREVFSRYTSLSEVAEARQGLITGNNDRFVKKFWEVDISALCTKGESTDRGRWFPYNKGGDYRRWYGNAEEVVFWANDGAAIRSYADEDGRPLSRPQSTEFYFREALTWSRISSSLFGVRYSPSGRVFDCNGPSLFVNSVNGQSLHGLLSSVVVPHILTAISPTLTFQVGDILKIPIVDLPEAPGVGAMRCIGITDWNNYERSWDFQFLPILTASSESMPTLEISYTTWISQNKDTIAEMKRLEEENNRLFIDAYGLADELTPDVPIEQITLTVNPAYRYGGKLTEENQWTRFRQDTMDELVSYAVGCMMGRYSLDAPGIIYANSGNESFDPSRYSAFPADDDGIIPITDHEWFDDDAACRFFRFIETAWDKKEIDANLDFIAEAIGCKASESSREAIRRYFVNGFYKNHCQTYKKRPIYWLFSSGKEKAFQALVYLHRYNEGTIARMRTEYVLPLQSKMTTRMEHLEKDKDHAASTSAANKIQKEIGKLRKQKEELLKFDEKLRHYADMKIRLDLDDGVKVNYGKFGDLLAEVKAITGGKK
jgi:type II restriction/modification system DNA methylase subunit YeeA